MSNPNQLSVIERLQNTSVGRFATAHVAALGLMAGGGAATHAAINTEHAPAAETVVPDANASLQQTCVQAGLVMPTVKTAKLLHPGSRHGRTQTAIISTENNAMPDECSGAYKRLSQAKIELQDKDHNKKWRFMRPYWRNMYSLDAAGVGGLSETPTGHEDESIYWDKGERARLVYRNIVKSSNGEIVGQKVKKYPIKIGG